MQGTILARNLSDTFRVGRGGPLLWPAARAFLSMMIPLAVLLQLDRIDLAPGAIFGALTSVYCRGEPYRRQGRTLAVVAAGMVLSVAFGAVISAFTRGAPWQAVIALAGTAFVGGISTAATTAVKVGAPGGLIFTFATGAYANLPLTASELPAHLGATVGSAFFAWLVSYLGALASGLRPHREHVANALEMTGSHLRARPDLATRHRAAVAVETAWNSLALVGKRHRETPDHLRLVQAVETCEELLTRDGADGTAPENVFASANAVRRGLASRPIGRTAGISVPPMPASRWRVIRDVLTASLRPGTRSAGWLVPYAFRVGLAAFASGALAHSLGIGHAYWAAISAVSILQATSTSKSVPRMLQRVSGTVFGVLAGVALLSAHPPLWGLVILLAMLQWGAEMTVTINYAFGLLFATQVALLVSALGSEVAPGELAAHRLWATLLGAVVAVCLAWALPHRAWLARVQDALAKVRAHGAEEPIRPHALRGALVELHEAYEVAEGEVRAGELPTEELLDVSHRAYALLDTVTQQPGSASTAVAQRGQLGSG